MVLLRITIFFWKQLSFILRLLGSYHSGQALACTSSLIFPATPEGGVMTGHFTDQDSKIREGVELSQGLRSLLLQSPGACYFLVKTGILRV